MPSADPIMPSSANSIRIPIHTSTIIALSDTIPRISTLQLLHNLHIRLFLRTPRSRQKIHKKRQDIKRENQRNNPLHDSADILLLIKGARSEDDCEDQLDDDEGELHPEAEAEDAVLPEMDPEALILGADEDCAYYVAGDEEEKETVVEVGMT